MRDQRTFLRTVVDADENLIYVRRADGAFDLCNAAFAAVFGARPEHLEGQPSGPIVARAPQLFAGDEDIAGGGLDGSNAEIGGGSCPSAKMLYAMPAPPLLKASTPLPTCTRE